MWRIAVQAIFHKNNRRGYPFERQTRSLFSGCLHGNERVGPTTVVELARLLAENYYYGENEWLKRLVKTRSIYIMPSANARGYYQNTREENGIDPNRDFPYDTPASECMKTTAARAVNELWREHLFQLAITFHGGMRAISYEWGSNNHKGSSIETYRQMMWDFKRFVKQWVNMVVSIAAGNTTLLGS